MTKEEIGAILKQLRISCGMTQKEVAEKLGRNQKIVGHWETGYAQPDANTLFTLCSLFGTSIDEAFGFARHKADISATEKTLLEKYRSLDQPGREHVDTVMQWESARVEQIADLENRIVIAGPAPAARTCSRIYPYMHKIAAAGVGFYFDDIPTDTLEAPYRDDADFIIGVNGDSMEPTYYDGDLVYVQKRQVVEPGDIGIFIVDGECYIKEAGEGGLISHNPKYKPISGGKEINCVGKVLGKVERN